MRKLLSFLAAALLSTAAHSAPFYQYEGTAFDCFLGFAGATPEQCSTATTISLWLRDDNTLDKVSYHWEGVAEYWPYGHTVDRNAIPADIWPPTVTKIDGVVVLVMRKSEHDALRWEFHNPEKWFMSYTSMPYYIWMWDGVARMGRDGLWEAQSVMQLVAASKVSEPHSLWLLALGAVAGLALRRRPVQLR